MYGPPVPFGDLHVTEPFECGEESLNVYLKRYAGQNEGRGGSRTFVIADRGNRVVGYYTLTAGSIEQSNAPVTVTKGWGKYPVPVIILARLAIDKSVQNQGLGSALLKDALKRVVFNISPEVGVRAVLIHAKNPKVVAWYKKHADFVESPTDPLHLFLLIQKIEKILKPNI
jgi:GNAT superfamily N-acetyltransferase